MSDNKNLSGTYLRKQSARLLEQLSSNRPRRNIDIDNMRKILEIISEPCILESLVDELIRAAWEWGVSCEIDNVRWGEDGDSHNQWWRDKTADLATRLNASLLTSNPKPSPVLLTDDEFSKIRATSLEKWAHSRAIETAVHHKNGHLYNKL